MKPFLISFTLIFSTWVDLNAQIGNAPCNNESPWTNTTYTNLTAHIINNVFSLVPPCLGGVSDQNNMINASLDDYAQIDITGVGCNATIAVRDNDVADTYPAGTWAGFNIGTGGLLPDATIASSVTIATWNNGVQQQTFDAGAALAGLNLGLNIGSRATVGFITSQPFDELRITYQTLVGVLFSARVYYPVIVKYCEGPEPSCNVSTALVQSQYPAFVSDAGATGITIGSVSSVNNVVNSNTNDFGTIFLPVGILATGYIAVKDQITDFPAGYFAGFEVSNASLLGLSLLDNSTITTYLNGIQQETKTGNNLLLSAPLLSASGRQTIGFVTSSPFDEVKYTISQPLTLNIGTTNIYHAVIKRYCAGPELACNEQTSINEPVFPVNIDGGLTGITGVACVGCSVNNTQNVIDEDSSNSGTIVLTAGLAVSGSIAVKDGVTVYPAGTFAGMEYQNPMLVGVDLLNSVQIRTYLDGVLQETSTNATLLAGESSLLNGNGRQIAGFLTTLPFNTVRISINQLLGVNLGTTQVFRAVFQKMCEGPALPCNTTTNLILPDYPVLVNNVRTGIDGLACVGCSINNSNNVINSNLNDYASIVLLAGVGISGSISVKDAITQYPSNTFVGFDIENPTLLDVSILDAIRIKTFLNGTLQENKTGPNALVSASTSLLTDDGRRVVGFIASLPFDEVQITVSNLVSVDLGVTRVYKLVLKGLCAVSIECDKTYFLSEPEFPVIVNGINTGISGLACVACSVTNATNVITEEPSDYATITVVAGVLETGSISVLDGISIFPAGSRAGFVIQDVNNLLQVDLFNTFTICTYLDGNLRECRSAGQLIDLALLFNWIGMGPGFYNIGFNTTMTYDEIRLSVGSLASVLNIIRVYSAFVDTRGAVGDGFNCCPTDSPALSSTSISNVCPSSAVNLNNLVISTTPANSTLVWFDGSDPLTSNQVLMPSTVTTTGTYFAFYYNNVPPNNCYGPASLAVNVVISICDSDGDGEPDHEDPEPNDPCVYSPTHVPTTANTSMTWKALDCDGDGVTNGEEIDSSDPEDPWTDPLDGCSYNVSEQIYANTTPEWRALDCDDDGNPNDTDPDPKVPTARDDAFTAIFGGPTSFNILANDDFLPGINTSITQTGGNAMGTVQFDPMTGLITYTPESSEIGMSVTVIYTVCHTVPNPDVCASATVTINVISSCVTPIVKVLLEGPYLDNNSNGIMTTKFNELGYLPGQEPSTFFGIPTAAGQPYGVAPWNYLGTEGDGFTTALGSKAGYPANTTDWVLVSLRTAISPSSTVCTKAALLLADGTVMMIDGFDCCDLDLTETYYIVIEHRNHLLVMSHTKVEVLSNTISYDFTLQDSYKSLLGYGQKFSNGKFVMFTGNGQQVISSSAATDINANDNDLWRSQNGANSSYYLNDFELNGDVNVQDKNIWLLNNGIFSDVPR